MKKIRPEIWISGRKLAGIPVVFGVEAAVALARKTM
jgi:hypothetical protein